MGWLLTRRKKHVPDLSMKLKLAARKAESPGVESFIFKPAKPMVW
jgi:hypothetical protein